MKKKFFDFKNFRLKRNYKKILGIILAVIGTVIVINVIPLTAWFFLLGILLIALGWVFYKMI